MSGLSEIAAPASQLFKLTQLLGAFSEFHLPLPAAGAAVLEFFGVFTFEFDARAGPACFLGSGFKRLFAARLLFPLLAVVALVLAYLVHNLLPWKA